MNPCEEYELLISEFIDGALDEADRAELMGHMAGCPVCQAYFDDQIAIHDALAQLEEVPAPAGLASQVMSRVRETPQERPAGKKAIPFPYWRRWAAVAACCAVAVLGVLRLQGPGSVPEGQQPAVHSAAVGSSSASGTEAPSALSAEDSGIAPQMRAAPEEGGPPAAMPAGSAKEYADGVAQDLSLDHQQYAGVLSTASPAAGAWVEEQLGLAWESGGSYLLTEEEAAALREALLAAGEAFDEAPGGPEGSGYLLLAG